MSQIRLLPNPTLISPLPLLPSFLSSYRTGRRSRSLLSGASFRRKKKRGFKACVINGTMNLRWPAFDEKLVQGKEEMDLPLELCVTCDLAPAVTLREGVNKIKEAMAKLKLDPPCSQSGVMRLQVRVPPSIKALNWLCSQLQLLEVFPHFFLSFGNEKDEVDFSSLNGLHAVSGFGASTYFDGSTHAPKANNILRYLSVDSPLIRAYGFIGTNCSKEASMLNSEDRPFCIFIPQIELNEYEDSSVLASTLIWDDYQPHTIQDAIESIELHLNQLVCVALPSNNFLSEKRLHDTYGHLNSPPVEDAQMVFVDAEHLARRDFQTNIFQLENFQDYFHYYFRFTAIKIFSKNMVSRSGGLSFSLHEFSNINALWASLIVEECVRLGLTYFCIAPGSRSSPLAISAATHPLTTCISSYDERSLAFHAVGYAKASSIPAVVITSSGTAVSNLLPAVVEASQDFVPLLLLTADRPPELQDNGANQAINQIDHFGKFVRFFSGLPPPSDEVLARMVLTTIDTAVQYATQEPCGPVHINCPFREPLADHPSDWTLNCLQGLDRWISNFKPFTTYINIQNFAATSENPHQLDEVLHALQKAERGLLLLGSINAEDEIWAAALVAEHLSWPVVPDILSGLRLRKLLSSLPSVKDHLLFVDHLDHALLSDLVKKWEKPDIILQLGSRITSKRIAQFVESCSSSAYIFVDKHPCRHDPLHLVSQRIQSTINVFAESLLKIQFPRTKTNWSSFLHAIDTTVSRELALQICLGDSLTEPYVAHVIAETLRKDGVLFVGNSMVIRDVDMYGQGWVKPVSSRAVSDQKLQCQGIMVVGNRGASGIDGLLSSASGFAAGCKKRVLCLVGDVSFLHDTNGLAILNERMQRKPMTVIVINNHGGGIFSFLPIAERTQSDILQKYFYTSHDISIAKLCAAHSIRSLCVRTKMELHHALSESQHSDTDCVIEVESCISENSDFHSLLKDSASEAATQALNSLLLTHDGASVSTIQKMEYSQYRFQLSAPLITPPAKSEVNDLQKEGFIISVILTDGTRGFGEVAPIKIHKENLKDAEEQLRFLLHTILGSELDPLFRLCNGSFSSWFWKALGIMPSSLFPSVRCGIEMALLHALASKQASSSSSLPNRHASLFGETGSPMNSVGDCAKGRSSHVPICALVDCSGTLKEVSQVVYQLLEEGFTTIKFKVGRRADPTEDGAIIQEIRSEFGYDLNIRVDANRSWSYEEALVFGQCVNNCNLQYIEEPVRFEDDIIKFCEETNLPVALDETIDNIREDLLHNLNKFVHPRIVAVVIKPSVVGGFENAALIAKWAQKHEKMAIISSAFESSLSLSSYVQFAGYLEHQRALLCRTRRIECFSPLAHGFGTYKWLKEDITTKPLKMYAHFNGGSLGVSHEDAVEMLLDFKIDEKVIQRSYSGEQLKSHPLLYNYKDYSCSIRLMETRMSVKHTVTVFLHGFLGTCEEWIPIMKALSAQTKCVSIDLPGHGQSYMKLKKEKRDQESRISVESVGDFLHSLLCDITDGRIILVGYSMGARIALYMSLKYKDKIEGAVLISGSPGLKDKSLRMTRAAEDEAKARFLSANGLQLFVDNWYRSKLWDSLRAHPRFEQIKASRKKHDDVCAVSQALSELSIGRQLSLWEDLRNCTRPLLLIVGENDKKFKEIACQMRNEILNLETEYPSTNKELCTMAEVPECGHAVHLEDPLAVINAVSKFLKRVSE